LVTKKSKSNFHYTGARLIMLPGVTSEHFPSLRFALGPTLQVCSGGKSLTTCGKI